MSRAEARVGARLEARIAARPMEPGECARECCRARMGAQESGARRKVNQRAAMGIERAIK
eukprot:6178550-Pleurochrysis_carterae.AAC.1